MKYKLKTTNRFEKCFKKLPREVKDQFKEKLILMLNDPYHSSLRTKKVKGTKEIFECSITMDIRATWQYEDGDIILFRNIGEHDITLKKP